MAALFWTSMAFMILYRVTSAVAAGWSQYNALRDSIYENGLTLHDAFRIFADGLLGLFDVYILKSVYVAIKQGEQEPTVKQKMVQLFESIIESLPQV